MGVPIKIQTFRLPNTSQKQYLLSSINKSNRWQKCDTFGFVRFLHN
jgi:hypothetical protein